MNNYEKHINNLRTKKIKKLEKIILKNKGIWLNKKQFKDSSSKCLIRCYSGHEFETHQSQLIKNSWCPICSGSYNIGEEITRIIFEELTGKKFFKTRRLPGLVNPKSGRPLEIDGFNKDLNIGFEYQGNQHFTFIPHIHRHIHFFEQQQQHDCIKREYFKHNQWVLLEIKQYDSFNIDNIIELVKQKMQGHVEINQSLKIRKIKQKIEKLFIFGKYYSEILDKISKQNFKIESGMFYNVKNVVVLKSMITNQVKSLSVATIIKSNFSWEPINKTKQIKKKKVRKNVAWNLELCKKAITSCKTSRDLQKKYPGAMSWILRHGFYYELTQVFQKSYYRTLRMKKWKYAEVAKLAKKYKTRSDFLRGSAGAYKAAKRMGIMEEVCSHMLYNKTGQLKKK